MFSDGTLNTLVRQDSQHCHYDVYMHALEHQTKWHWQVHCALKERAQVCCEQTSSIPQHGRVRRGREWKSSFGDEYLKQTHLTAKFQIPALMRAFNRKEKKKSNKS